MENLVSAWINNSDKVRYNWEIKEGVIWMRKDNRHINYVFNHLTQGIKVYRFVRGYLQATGTITSVQSPKDYQERVGVAFEVKHIIIKNPPRLTPELRESISAAQDKGQYQPLDKLYRTNQAYCWRMNQAVTKLIKD